jgi:hypothetical protein
MRTAAAMIIIICDLRTDICLATAKGRCFAHRHKVREVMQTRLPQANPYAIVRRRHRGRHIRHNNPAKTRDTIGAFAFPVAA